MEDIVRSVIESNSAKQAQSQSSAEMKSLITAMQGLLAKQPSVNIDIPEVNLSPKQIGHLVVGLNEIVKRLEKVEQAQQTSTGELKKALKPEKVDLKPLITAINDIYVPEVEIPSTIKVSNLDELKKPLLELASKLKLELPEIKIPEFPKSVSVDNLEGVEAKLDKLVEKASEKPEQTPIDLSSVVEATKGVDKTIKGLRFPVPQFNIPKTPDGHVPVEIIGGGASDGAIVDGSNSAIKATVKDLTNSNPLTTQIVDANGDAITSFGGGTQYTEGDTDASITGTALLFEGAADTLVAAPGTAANGLDVDVTRVSGTVTVDGSGVTQPVSNAGLTELAAAINASSQMDVNIAASDISFGGTSAADDADFTAGTTPGTPSMGVYESTPTSVTDGDLGTVGITTGRAMKVQAQANSGVDIGDVTINNATIAVTQSGTWDEVGINDSGNSITVDATNLDVRDLSATSDTITVHGDVGVIDQLDLTNSNPAAVAIVDGDGTQITSFGGGTQYSDGDANADPTGTVAMGTDGSNVFAVHTDTSGDLQVDILSIAAGDNNIGNVDVASSALPTGASTAANQTTIIGHVDGIEGLLTTIDTDTGNIDTSLNAIEAGYATEGSALGSGVLLQGDDGTDRTNVLVDTSGHLQVDVLTAPTTTVQATDLDIRDLTATDVVTANLSATDNAVLDSIDTSTQGILADTAAIQTAVETIDNAISGSEMQVDVVAALPAGTNALGKVLPPDTDVTAHTNYAKKYYTSTGAATDGIIWSPAAGKRWHVVSMFINVSAAATVTLEDDKSGGDEAVMKMELAANSGTVINFSEMYPFASGEDAADLTVTTTAGNVYITCTGYEV